MKALYHEYFFYFWYFFGLIASIWFFYFPLPEVNPALLVVITLVAAIPIAVAIYSIVTLTLFALYIAKNAIK